MLFWITVALAFPPSPRVHPVRPPMQPPCLPSDAACTPVLTRGLIDAPIRRWRQLQPMTSLGPAVFTAFPAREVSDLTTYVPQFTSAGGTLRLADVPFAEVAVFQDGVRLR